jgi:hypothetical protein
MIPVVDIYNDVTQDNINVSENGDMPISMFNRISRRAELRIIEFLTGDISGIKPPMPDITQKNRDWLSPFVAQYPVNVTNGQVDRPSDYYTYDNSYRISGYNKVDCETDQVSFEKGCDIPITILQPQAFKNRCNSYIKSLRPSFKNPIAKLTGKKIYIEPYDLGSICIEYVRYPVFAKIVPKIDDTYKEEVPDLTKSQNYEWDEAARELLIWFITDTYSNRTREEALKQMNYQTGKLVREQKQ